MKSFSLFKWVWMAALAMALMAGNLLAQMTPIGPLVKQKFDGNVDANGYVVSNRGDNHRQARRSWSKIYQLLNGGTTSFNVLTWGDSVGATATQYIVPRIKAAYGNRGIALNAVHYAGESGSANWSGMDLSSWFCLLIRLNANSDGTTASGGGAALYPNANLSGGNPIYPAILCDTVTLYYGTRVGGGTFKVQTSTTGTTWTDVAGLTAVSGSAASEGARAGVPLTFSPAAGRGYYWIRVAHVSGGSVDLFGVRFVDSTVNGVVDIGINSFGNALVDRNAVPRRMWEPVMRDLAPDVEFIQMKDDPSTWLVDLEEHYNQFKRVLPVMDFVVANSNPVGAPPATSGSYKLTFNGQTTAWIAYNASEATVQSAFQSLSSVGSGNALVTATDRHDEVNDNTYTTAYTVEFLGTLGNQAQSLITSATSSGLVDTYGAACAPVITQTWAGNATHNAVQTIKLRSLSPFSDANDITTSEQCKTFARNHGLFFYDTREAFSDYETMMAYGWSNLDGVHPSLRGSFMQASKLLEELGWCNGVAVDVSRVGKMTAIAQTAYFGDAATNHGSGIGAVVSSTTQTATLSMGDLLIPYRTQLQQLSANHSNYPWGLLFVTNASANGVLTASQGSDPGGRMILANNPDSTFKNDWRRLIVKGDVKATGGLLTGYRSVAESFSFDDGFYTGDDTIAADATSAAISGTLPSVAALNKGRHYRCVKTDSSANAVTITAAGSDTINGAATYALTAQWQGAELIGSGTNGKWVIIGKW